MLSKSLLIRLTVFILTLAIPITVFGDSPIGRPSGGGSSIQWDIPGDSHERIELRVIDPHGEVYTRLFAYGTTVSFPLQDLPEVVDGQYSYEMHLIPKISAELRQRLAATRAAGDEAGARRLLREAHLGEPIKQSGGFQVYKGSIVTPGLVEPGPDDGSAANATATRRGAGPGSNAARGKVTVNDQVIPDDLIVQGSACIGPFCVNGEAFGADTLRLKEPTVIVHFEDTSTSPFPSNDWRIRINDNTSGGQNYFSIEDTTGIKIPVIVEAGSPTNSLHVDSTGRIGFRTSTPAKDLHVNTGDTPAIRFEQNSSGGFTAQTWDIAGNEVNFFVRDVTNGDLMPFRIRPGAPTSSIDIDADGIVGIGTASPGLVNGITRGVHISAEFPALRITATGTGGHDYQFQTGNSGQLGISDVTGGTNNNRIFIAGTGNVGIGTTTTTSKLTVAGDVRTVGGAFIDDGVTLNAPDYVFDESYRLMPLEEVARFIEENNHLPNVPSAKEIKSTGLNLSQMQMRLLEKVEELTLYTLGQHRTIAELKAQNEALAERLKTLEELKQPQ